MRSDDEALLVPLVQWRQLLIPTAVFAKWREGSTSHVPAPRVWGVGNLCHLLMAADGRCLSVPLQQGPCSYRPAPLPGENVSSQINTRLII